MSALAYTGLSKWNIVLDYSIIQSNAILYLIKDDKLWSAKWDVPNPAQQIPDV